MQEPANIGSTHAALAQRRARIQEQIISLPLLVDRSLITLLADGHLLVEDAPGLAQGERRVG